MAITESSRRPSRAQLTRASRHPSRLDAKGAAGSDQPDWSPGRSYLNRLSSSPKPYLELRLATTRDAGRGVIGLTQRDVAILQALDCYRYLDRHQIQTLFFQGPRSCQYRLKWLAEHGLVNAWHVVIRPGHVRSPSICMLSSRGASALADLTGDDPRQCVLRAEHALSRHHYLVHDLEANQLFVDLARATSTMPTLGLYHWVGEHGIRRAYAEERGPVPDGWGRVLLGDRELFLHLELVESDVRASPVQARATLASSTAVGDLAYPGPAARRRGRVSPDLMLASMVRSGGSSPMSPAAAAAAIWSPRVTRSRGRRARRGSKHESPLVEVPSQFVRPIEQVMEALTVAGQKEFKGELAKAAKSDDPAEALEFVVSSWLRTSYLMAEPGFREALEMLPELSKESKPMTLEQLSDRIGL